MISIVIAIPAFAQQQPFPNDPPGGGNPGGNVLVNPLAGVDTIDQLIPRIINWVLGFSAMIALLALVIGGLRMIGVFAGEDNLKKGKQIIMWAVIGLVVIISAYAIIKAVTGVLGISSN